MDVKGWSVIVTGSAAGIGAATALQLAKAGANVVINYTKSEQEANDVQAACEAAGAETMLIQADVSRDGDCRRMVQATADKWGRIDGLVNNAGTSKFVAHDDLDGLSADDFQRIYSVNVIGPYQMTRQVLPHMKSRGQGAIVNVSSVAGVMGIGSSIAYAASKGALNTMTLSLARIAGPEVRVNTICPGFVQGRWLRGGMGDERYEATKQHLEETMPLRRTGEPDDMASLIVYLLAGNRNMTGEIITCDSGSHLGMAPLAIR